MSSLDGDFWSNAQAEKIHLKQELCPELLNKSELALLQLHASFLDTQWASIKQMLFKMAEIVK